MTGAADSDLTCRKCGSNRPDRADLASRCDACLRRDARVLWLMVAVLAVVAGAGLSEGDQGRMLSSTFGILLGLIVGFPASVVVHEGGHGLAAILVRMRLRRLVIGNGPLLVSFAFGGVHLELRRYQGIGSTWAETINRTHYRKQWSLFGLAGPAASISAAVFSFLLAGGGFLGTMWFSIGLVHALMAVATLRPGSGFGGTVSSDVVDLREVLAMSPESVEADIAYTASLWVGEFAESGQKNAARDVVAEFVGSYPDSEHRPWFEDMLSRMSPD